MPGDEGPRAIVGIGRSEPIFPVRDLEVAMVFYAKLGFSVRRYDAGYGYAEREGLRLHLRASPELEPFSPSSEVYVDTAEVDALHEEWRTRGLLPVRASIDEALGSEVRRRREAGEPVGLMSAAVEDKPWRVREFSIRDPDDNQLRFGRQIG
jgi:hypothetical protein